MTLRPYSATLQKTYRDTLETPGAPETIDDSVPVMPVAIVGGSITATTEITGISLATVGGSGVSNTTTTILTAGANGARIYGGQLAALTGAGNGVASLLVNGVALLSITPYNTSQDAVSVHLGANYIALAAGQVVAIYSSSVNVTAAGTVQYVQL